MGRAIGWYIDTLIGWFIVGLVGAWVGWPIVVDSLFDWLFDVLLACWDDPMDSFVDLIWLGLFWFGFVLLILTWFWFDADLTLIGCWFDFLIWYDLVWLDSICISLNWTEIPIYILFDWFYIIRIGFLVWLGFPFWFEWILFSLISFEVSLVLFRLDLIWFDLIWLDGDLI